MEQPALGPVEEPPPPLERPNGRQWLEDLLHRLVARRRLRRLRGGTAEGEATATTAAAAGGRCWRGRRSRGRERERSWRTARRDPALRSVRLFAGRPHPSAQLVDCAHLHFVVNAVFQAADGPACALGVSLYERPIRVLGVLDIRANVPEVIGPGVVIETSRRIPPDCQRLIARLYRGNRGRGAEGQAQGVSMSCLPSSITGSSSTSPGTHPSRSGFLPRNSSCSPFRLPRLAGMSPVSSFSSRWRRVKLLRSPSSPGMLPVNWFWKRYSQRRLDSCPNCVGMDPPSGSPHRDRTCRLVKLLKPDGTPPVNWFLEADKVVRLVWLLQVVGKDPDS